MMTRTPHWMNISRVHWPVLLKEKRKNSAFYWTPMTTLCGSDMAGMYVTRDGGCARCYKFKLLNVLRLLKHERKLTFPCHCHQCYTPSSQNLIFVKSPNNPPISQITRSPSPRLSAVSSSMSLHTFTRSCLPHTPATAAFSRHVSLTLTCPLTLIPFPITPPNAEEAAGE
jgi:hypothetical protein